MTLWNENENLKKVEKAMGDYLLGETPNYLLRQDVVMSIVQLAKRTEELKENIDYIAEALQLDRTPATVGKEVTTNG